MWHTLDRPDQPDRPPHRPPTVALVAHDAEKDRLVDLARQWRPLLCRVRLIATATTGGRLGAELDLPVELAISGPLGGDLQIGARIAGGEVDAVVFLRDPLTVHAHEPDIQALLKVCDVHQVPLATNLATAELVLQALSRTLSGTATPAGRPPA